MPATDSTSDHSRCRLRLHLLCGVRNAGRLPAQPSRRVSKEYRSLRPQSIRTGLLVVLFLQLLTGQRSSAPPGRLSRRPWVCMKRLRNLSLLTGWGYQGSAKSARRALKNAMRCFGSAQCVQESLYLSDSLTARATNLMLSVNVIRNMNFFLHIGRIAWTLTTQGLPGH
jgi:hypothetical protein